MNRRTGLLARTLGAAALLGSGCGTSATSAGDAAAVTDGGAPTDAAAGSDDACWSAPVLVTPPNGPSDDFPGVAPIPSNFDVDAGLQPAWGTGAIPVSAKPDVVGAFRFICGAGHLLYDDPIVYPCQPGASHLHQFYGNASTNAYSTYASLRASGDSTCANGDHPANRSAYWTPAMLDGKGNVVQPDWEAVYYKRRPLTDPKCSLTSGDPQAQGNCVPIPNGIQFTFGFNQAKPDAPVEGSGHYNCLGTDPNVNPMGPFPDIPTAAPHCVVGGQLQAVIDAPTCWDGKNLDVPDHRSHMSYPGYGDWGYLKCDAQHPYVIPAFHLAITYSIAPGDDLTLWTLSSDEHAPKKPHGYTLHGDYKEAWDNGVKTRWLKGCVDSLLNCSGGDLGDGSQIVGASQPKYGWKNPAHLVPLSSVPMTPRPGK